MPQLNYGKQFDLNGGASPTKSIKYYEVKVKDEKDLPLEGTAKPYTEDPEIHNTMVLETLKKLGKYQAPTSME